MYPRKSNVNISDLYERFAYNPATGDLIYKVTVGGNKAGKIAGSLHKRNGYKYVAINGACYLQHKVVYAMYYGRWPTKDIDHINGNRADNRISNIRMVGRKENSKNKRIQKRNKLGITGVYWYKQLSKWNPQIRVDSKMKNLGYFSDFFEACCARKSAEVVYGYHENHGR